MIALYPTHRQVTMEAIAILIPHGWVSHAILVSPIDCRNAFSRPKLLLKIEPKTIVTATTEVTFGMK